MAADDDTARPVRVPFFRTASDDELVNVEAYIQDRCAILYRSERMLWRRARGKRPAWPRSAAAAKGHRHVRLRHAKVGKVDLGMLRAFKAAEMRRAIERATLAERAPREPRRLREPRWLRDKVGDLLETLPERSQLDPFVGVFARSADLEAFAEREWSVRNEPEADEIPQQRYLRAAELYARLKNYAAVGRALNVKPTRARELVARGQAIASDGQSTPTVDAARKPKPGKGEK